VSDRPDLEGQRLKHAGGQDPIYVVIDGILRWIPNLLIFERLFRDWNIQQIDLNNITGFNSANPNTGLYPLPSMTTLVRGGQPEVYLIDYRNILTNDRTLVKRWVPSPAFMDLYNFDWDDIANVRQIIIDAIPKGGPLA
jgi:hypothetical protein